MASSSHDQSGFSPLGSLRGTSAGILPYHSIPASLQLGNTTTSGGFGVEYLQQSLEVSGKLCVSSSCISSSSSINVSGGTCLLILVAPCWMEAPWLPTVLNLLADIPWHHAIVKDLSHGCFSVPHGQRSAISAFNPLAAQRCVLHRQGFSSSVF